MSASSSGGFVAYAQKACECRPRYLCSFCRAGRYGDPRKAPKARQRPAQPPAVATPVRVGYRAAHARVVAARGRASSYSCVGDCGRPAVDWAYDNDDPDEVIDTVGGKPLRYGLDSDHYQPMCRQCHQRFDHAQRAQRLEVFSSW